APHHEQRRRRPHRRAGVDEVHARRVRAAARSRRLGPSGRAGHARSRLVEWFPRDAVLPARGTALGVVLSEHRAHSSVSGAFAVRRRRHAIALLRIRAGRVHPVTAPSFEDGAVLVNGEGRIAAVGANADVPTPRAARVLHFPDAELLPGLVNCHTHLELTQLGGGAKYEEPEFVNWI